jgi:hypothetical protein
VNFSELAENPGLLLSFGTFHAMRV